MLLDFSVSNFKSFADTADFSMLAAPKQTGLDYSLASFREGSRKVRSICSSVIYGPNASGKSNIISAMDVLRAIVLRGNIRNAEEHASPNPASVSLELIPNKSLSTAKPVSFSIDFYEKEMRFHYKLSIDLGKFLKESHKRKILSEELYVNNEMVFSRGDTLVLGNFKKIVPYIMPGVSEEDEGTLSIARNGLNPEELFLTNGFKLIYAPALAGIILDWMTNKFMVICRADSMQLIRRFSDVKKQSVYVVKTVNEAAKLFGINSNAVGYVVNDDDKEAKLCSIFNDQSGKRSVAIPADIFESYGTIRFINLFPIVIRAIRTGGTLVVDEFDASIHPKALMSIISVFHNDDINLHHAQLIFNTHNPIFLNSNLFRRDEIKFVERDDDTHNSILYSLSDFGTAGENGVRKNEDYMTNYFVSRYGAIKDIDFSPIFEEIMNSDKKET